MAFDTKALLPELVNDGIRLLVYAGDCDTMCTNYIGKERWVEALNTKFHNEFSKAKLLPWYDSATGRHAGEVRSAGTAGNLTYVRIYDAGHMAPYDQPEALLDLITRWLREIPRLQSQTSLERPGIQVAITVKGLATLLAFASPLTTLLTYIPTIHTRKHLERKRRSRICCWNIHTGANTLPKKAWVTTSPYPTRHSMTTNYESLNQSSDLSVKQYSGYLDISEFKHLFFWFFESRKSPSNAPLLSERWPRNFVFLGTFSAARSMPGVGRRQKHNVGFSNDHNRNTVHTNAVGAQDVYAFFQLFYHRFPEYATLLLRVAGMSYAGIYVSNIASAIYQKNKDAGAGLKYINLASVVLANATENPRIQYPSIFDYACEEGAPYTVFDPEAIGYNPYDIRKTCPPRGIKSFCYDEPIWIGKWMNTPANKIGEMAFDTKALLPELVDGGVRLLVYAGNCDAICTNYVGQERWVEALDTSHHDEFIKAKLLPWYDSATGRQAGEVRSADTVGNLTYVRIYDAGQAIHLLFLLCEISLRWNRHMGPYDQPEALLDLITRWIREIPFA
uniref:Putative serine carboxypeptidase n=1 Tax=Moniliophthora roreri TaxID=221103 RepID=A0A0W0G1Q7_MONRR